MRALVLALLLSGCQFGDNVVVELDAGVDSAAEHPSTDDCCRLLFPLLDFDATRACVAERTASGMCRRLDCIVFDEWVCHNGTNPTSTEVGADGVTVCTCRGEGL